MLSTALIRGSMHLEWRRHRSSEIYINYGTRRMRENWMLNTSRAGDIFDLDHELKKERKANPYYVIHPNVVKSNQHVARAFYLIDIRRLKKWYSIWKHWMRPRYFALGFCHKCPFNWINRRFRWNIIPRTHAVTTSVVRLLHGNSILSCQYLSLSNYYHCNKLLRQLNVLIYIEKLSLV